MGATPERSERGKQSIIYLQFNNNKMKRLKFGLMGIMIATSVFTSCSNEENLGSSEKVSVVTIDNKSTLQQISYSIDSINTKRLGIPPFIYNDDTRAFSIKNLWKGIKTVVAADARGAADGLKSGGFPGAVTGAISSSFSKVVDLLFKDDAQTVDPNPNNNKSPRKTTIYYNNDSIFKNMTRAEVDETVLKLDRNTNIQMKEDSAGYYHNKVILSLLDKHNNVKYWQNITHKDLTIEVAKELEREFNLNEGQLYNDSELIGNIATNSFILGSAEEDILNSYYINLRKNNPKMADLIDVIETYVNGLGEIESTDECIEYSEAVMDIINKSNANEDEKLSLRICINVAFSSYRLWNPDVFNK